jgi:phage replication O-like protein O
MGSPQLEDGYIKIANELFGALVKIRIPGEARQMFDLIIRKTYGFNKKHDRISTSQIMEETGLSHIAVYKARRKLKEMNLITVSEKGETYIVTYSINKHYKTWKVSPKKETLSKKGEGVSPKKESNCLPKGETQKTKDNIQKTRTFSPPSLEDVKNYVAEISSPIDPLQFHSKQEAIGWMVGKNPMKDWKATIRYWGRCLKGKTEQPKKSKWIAA